METKGKESILNLITAASEGYSSHQAATVEEEIKMRIMKLRAFRLLLAGLMLLSLFGRAAVAQAETGTDLPPEGTAPGNDAAKVIEVQNVDELLAAIGPNVTVALAAGEYDLASAATYGKSTGNPYCRWESVSENGYELYITGADGLVLSGAGMGKTTILAEDRYASVLNFMGCRNLTVSGITAGHNPAPGYCSGGVLHLINCNAAVVEGCGLFGGGTVGVWAETCSGVTVTASRIYECSDSAVYAINCRNVRVLDSEIDHNGWKSEFLAYSLFACNDGDGFMVAGCRIHDNIADHLLHCYNTGNIWFVSSQVEYNRLQSAFGLFNLAATVDGCSFDQNDVIEWYVRGYEQASLAARDLEGKTLSEDALEAMELREVQLPEAESEEQSEPMDVAPGSEIVVTNTDEFLAAIGPDRTIVLDGESFSLADGYGTAGNQYYHWEECYDGPQLVITNVSNLTIRGAAEGNATTLTATPRYADVLLFTGCENVTVMGLTLGHSEGAGDCSGAVLDFASCSGISLKSCRLYGCGTLGVNAEFCIDLKIEECEIYECSFGGVVLYSVSGAAFTGCWIHDVPSPALSLYNCFDVSWNGQAVDGAHYNVTLGGELRPASLG